MMSVADDVRRFWDEDSAVYDRAPNHHPTDPAEQAAWTATLDALLPPPPAHVLDCGAGTGFLSIAAARLGHRVTALDLSPGMLERLRAKAEKAGVEIEVVAGPAEQPPPGRFDAVIERHLMWTLTDPVEALRAWRRAAPAGRVVLFESLWGTADPVAGIRRVAQGVLATTATWAGRTSPGQPRGGHHAEYPPALRRQMPLGSGTTPAAVVGLATEAGWPAPRLYRLRDVEWAASVSRPWHQRLLGVPARFAIAAGA